EPLKEARDGGTAARAAPGNARAARAEGAVAGADARLGAGAADRADEPGRVPGEPGLAVPGVAADEAEGVDPLGVAGDGEQPAGALLHADAGGLAAAGAGAGELGAGVGGGEPGAGLGGGVATVRRAFRALGHAEPLEAHTEPRSIRLTRRRGGRGGSEGAEGCVFRGLRAAETSR